MEVDSTRSTTLPHPGLDASTGGQIPTHPGQSGSPSSRSPREALYRVRIQLEEQPAAAQVAIGETRMAGEGRAWLPTAVNRILAVGVREMGF